MMEEIARTVKFEAWVKSQGVMYTVRTIRFDEQGVMMLYLSDRQGRESERGLLIDQLNEVILREYTGINDRHGKPIYEGDILHVRFGRHRVEVRWKTLGFAFWNLGTQQWQLLYASDLKQIEVIGNRYEHPELLNEEVSA